MHRTVTVWAQAWRMVLESLAQDRRKAVGNVCGCMLGHNFKLNLRTAVRARAFNNAFELHGKVDSVVVERVDAGAYELERPSTVRLTSAKSAATPGSSAWTTRRASACSETRVSWCPTLSWISRAMRARSASVASSTS